MKLVKEFKEFAVKGNMLDMAVGIIIGVAFGKIISILVANVIMPPVGMLLGKVDFSNLKIVLQAASTDAAGKAVPEVAIGYGLFLNAVLDMLIVAFSVFMLIKLVNAALRKQPKPSTPPPPTKDQELLAEIRDLLKTRP